MDTKPDDMTRWEPYPHTCPKCDQGEIGAIMKSHDRGRWVRWDDYKAALKKQLVDKAGWIGMSGDQSARVAELEAEVKKLKEDRLFLAKTIESILPVSIDKFSEAVLKKKPKKNNG